MSRLQSNRRTDGPGTAAWVAIGTLCVVLSIGVIILGAWQIGVAASDGQDSGWTTTATIVAMAGTILVLAFTGIILWALLRGNGGKTRVDHAARYLGNKNKADLAPFTEEAVATQAERLHASGAGPGVPLGEPVSPR